MKKNIFVNLEVFINFRLVLRLNQVREHQHKQMFILYVLEMFYFLGPFYPA